MLVAAAHTDDNWEEEVEDTCMDETDAKQHMDSDQHKATSSLCLEVRIVQVVHQHVAPLPTSRHSTDQCQFDILAHAAHVVDLHALGKGVDNMWPLLGVQQRT